MAVEPPTEPAVCTRNIGLPTAPSASARYSSGIITPSKKSGALPMTTASMSRPRHLGVVERPLGRGAHHARRSRRRWSPGAWSGRCRRWLLVRLPITPPPGRRRGSAAGTGPTVAWATARSASPLVIRLAASPMRMRPAAMIGLARQRAARRVDRSRRRPARARRRRISSWWVNGACSSARSTVPSADAGLGRRLLASTPSR